MELNDIIQSIILFEEVRNDAILNNSDVAGLLCAAEEYGFNGNIFNKYIVQQILSSDNLFSKACDRRTIDKNMSIYKVAARDLSILKDVFEMGAEEFGDWWDILSNYTPINRDDNKNVENFLSLSNVDEQLDFLINYYSVNGAGILSEYVTFALMSDGQLLGVGKKNAFFPELDDLIGLESQKREICANTEAFLRGLPAANVLLAGTRGMGKSTMVQALAGIYAKDGLRLIQAAKSDFENLPILMENLRKSGRKFIIFLDDLSFDESEREYKYLKSILEGGVVKKPDNILFYATSNRRHLVAERYADKQGAPTFDSDGEELHITDTVNEKLSLFDRFGLTITFTQPSPAEFVRIVTELAKKRQVQITENDIMQQINGYSASLSGLSGRVASQFVDKLVKQKES